MRQIVLLLPYIVACGSDPILVEPSTPLSAEIVGGSLYSGQPAVGALFVDGAPHCTGTLITRRKVVTAAHCVTGVLASHMEFRLGADAFAPTKIMAVTKVKPHRDFDPDTLVNDIGFVILRANAPVAPLPVVRMDDDWIDTELRFVGYGVTSATTNRGAGRKRSVWLPIVQIDDTAFAFDGAGRSTCFGDSGGPALHISANGAAHIAGVTSWGDADCSGFGADTRVDAFLGFLGVGATGPFSF